MSGIATSLIVYLFYAFSLILYFFILLSGIVSICPKIYVVGEIDAIGLNHFKRVDGINGPILENHGDVSCPANLDIPDTDEVDQSLDAMDVSDCTWEIRRFRKNGKARIVPTKVDPDWYGESVMVCTLRDEELEEAEHSDEIDFELLEQVQHSDFSKNPQNDLVTHKCEQCRHSYDAGNPLENASELEPEEIAEKCLPKPWHMVIIPGNNTAIASVCKDATDVEAIAGYDGDNVNLPNISTKTITRGDNASGTNVMTLSIGYKDASSEFTDALAMIQTQSEHYEDEIDYEDFEDYVDYENYEDYEDYEDDGGLAFAGFNLPTDLVYATSMAYEESFLKKLGSSTAAEEYIWTVVELAQILLKHESLGSKVHLDVKKPARFLPNLRLKVNNPSICETKNIASNESLVIFVYDFDDDLNMGVSKRAAGCDPAERKIVVKFRSMPWKAAIVLAHEYGHLILGVFHDDEEDYKRTFKVSGNCDTGYMMMSKSPPMDGRQPIWSACNRARFEKFYRNGGFKCLETASPPKIAELPEKVKLINVGENVILTCNTQGAPRPIIQWYNYNHTYKLLTGDKYKFHESGTLEIRNVEFVDAGNYTCNATNIFGYQTTWITLSVKEDWASIIFQWIREHFWIILKAWAFFLMLAGMIATMIYCACTLGLQKTRSPEMMPVKRWGILSSSSTLKDL